MPFQIVRDDIKTMQVDAIVSIGHIPAGEENKDLTGQPFSGRKSLWGRAGRGYHEYGCARLTRARGIPAKYIIHITEPAYQDGQHIDEAEIGQVYQDCMEAAAARKCRSLAVPLLTADPAEPLRETVLKTAVSEIGRFLLDHDMMIYLAVDVCDSFRIGQELMTDVSGYIDWHYGQSHPSRRAGAPTEASLADADMLPPLNAAAPSPSLAFSRPAAGAVPSGLKERVEALDESFSQALLRLIDEKGMTDVECYRGANIDRKLFSKIRSNPSYKPSKPTAIAFAISLRLDLDETRDFLMKAGFALSHSSKFDIIIEYFIQSGNYNIFEINEVLFAFDQVLLGG
ncbi:MAG: macro domain-containing protein [Oscillospiraceae bacterium]|nr:macro domain-containing protein [Oscillospiraceae bacterium]